MALEFMVLISLLGTILLDGPMAKGKISRWMRRRMWAIERGQEGVEVEGARGSCLVSSSHLQIRIPDGQTPTCFVRGMCAPSLLKPNGSGEGERRI